MAMLQLMLLVLANMFLGTKPYQDPFTHFVKRSPLDYLDNVPFCTFHIQKSHTSNFAFILIIYIHFTNYIFYWSQISNYIPFFIYRIKKKEKHTPNECL